MTIAERARHLYARLDKKPPGRETAIARTEAQTAELLSSYGQVGYELAEGRMLAAELWALSAPAYAEPITK